MDASLLLKYPYVKKQLGKPVKPEDIVNRSYRDMYNFDPPPAFEPETRSIFPPAVGGPAKGGGSWRNTGMSEYNAIMNRKREKAIRDQAAVDAANEGPSGRVAYL